MGYTVGQFNQLDIPDYMLIMEAVEYREEDKSFWVHFAAWQNMRANGKKKAGKGYKTAFPRFKMFYNVEKAMRSVKENRNKKRKDKAQKAESRLQGLGRFLKQKQKEETNIDG